MGFQLLGPRPDRARGDPARPCGVPEGRVHCAPLHNQRSPGVRRVQRLDGPRLLPPTPPVSRWRSRASARTPHSQSLPSRARTARRGFPQGARRTRRCGVRAGLARRYPSAPIRSPPRQPSRSASMAFGACAGPTIFVRVTRSPREGTPESRFRFVDSARPRSPGQGCPAPRRSAQCCPAQCRPAQGIGLPGTAAEPGPPSLGRRGSVPSARAGTPPFLRDPGTPPCPSPRTASLSSSEFDRLGERPMSAVTASRRAAPSDRSGQ
jgi:hypothetical protein